VNRLYYGEALLKANKQCEAAAQFRAAIETPSNPDWAYMLERTQETAREHLAKTTCPK
jgi:hypothetical protein